MKSVVITGANGFLGSNLVGHFIELGVKVKAIVRQNSDRELLKNLSCDICVFNGSIESLSSVINENSVVIHTASYYVAEHKSSDLTALVESNILFGLQLLEAMKISGAKHIINIGTSWQSYEDVDRRPVNLYAATKQAFEDLLSYYSDAENFRAISLRLFDTYGENDSRMKLLKLLITIGIKGKSLDMSPGEQVIDLVHIDDVCTAVSQAYFLVDSQNGLSSYNVSSGKRLSLKELVNLVEIKTGLTLDINWGEKEYRKREVITPCESKPLLNWKPIHNIEDGIIKIFNKLTNDQ